MTRTSGRAFDALRRLPVALDLATEAALAGLKRAAGGDLSRLDGAQAAVFFQAADYLADELGRAGNRKRLAELLGEVRSVGRPNPAEAAILERLGKLPQ